MMHHIFIHLVKILYESLLLQKMIGITNFFSNFGRLFWWAPPLREDDKSKGVDMGGGGLAGLSPPPSPLFLDSKIYVSLSYLKKKTR